MLTYCDSALKSDRLIKIIVGNATTSTFHVHESLLTKVSEYFVKAIKNEHLGSDEPGVLQFPHDSQDAWELLLYWVFKGAMPVRTAYSHDDIAAFVGCWCLGDKYLMPELQDQVMLDLLLVLEGDKFASVDIVKQAFENTAAGSKLRDVMAEEVLRTMHLWDNDGGVEFDDYDGIAGFTAAIVAAKDRDPKGDYFYDRFRDNSLSYTSKWRYYMVGEAVCQCNVNARFPEPS